MSRAVAGLTRFRADRRGTIAVIFGLTVFLLISITGLAIDASRVYNISNKIAAVLDAAALAGAKLMNENASETQVRARAQAYFEAHTPEHARAWRRFP